MTKKEEYVDFVARDGVTIYTGRSVAGHPAGTTVRLPKNEADAIAHLAADNADEPAEPADQNPADENPAEQA